MEKNSTVYVSENNCRIHAMHADEYTPITIAHATKAQGLLESVNSDTGRSRYSFVLVKELFRIVQDDSKIFIQTNKKKVLYKEDTEKKAIFLELLRTFSEQHAQVYNENGLDIPFPSGGIGYLSFEYAKYCDTFRFAEQPDSLKQPEALFIIPHTFIVFDHVEEMLYLVALDYDVPPDMRNNPKIKIKRNNLQKSLKNINSMLHKAKPLGITKGKSFIVENKNDAKQYCDSVDEIRKKIIEGYLLQAVPSRRVKVKSTLKPEETYRLLRHHNPAPYMFFLNFGDHYLLGSSPESHVRTVRGKAFVTPIAGTRRRGNSTAEDMQLSEDLLSDKKERAEHIMLVDLARNDLSRVCTPESVTVSEFMNVKFFARVMHIVSQVSGTLANKNGDRLTGIDALKATFPAGTVSGAPKIQAVYEISKLEAEKRGFYAGVVGYLMPNGDIDTCITLRSILYKKGHYYLQSGAGVVYDSVPSREYEETQEKISALARTLGI